MRFPTAFRQPLEEHSQPRVHMKYYFDPDGYFETLDGNADPSTGQVFDKQRFKKGEGKGKKGEGKGAFRGACYNCGKEGHMAHGCPAMAQAQAGKGGAGKGGAGKGVPPEAADSKAERSLEERRRRHEAVMDKMVAELVPVPRGLPPARLEARAPPAPAPLAPAPLARTASQLLPTEAGFRRPSAPTIGPPPVLPAPAP